MSDCSVCLGQHDEEIHAATLWVRKWFRTRIQPVKIKKPKKGTGKPAIVTYPAMPVSVRYKRGSESTGFSRWI